MAGYIKIPRDLFASAEWLTPRVFGKVDAQLDLLQLATYTEERIIRCKSGDVTLRRGQLLTTMRHLADRWGWSAASVHRFLSSLREVREGCIRLLIETTPSEGKTLITIVDYDRWDVLGDETSFETTSATHRETRNETTFGTNRNDAMRSESVESEFEKTHRETEDETRFETTTETHRETRNETQYEVKYSNTGLERKDSNTHTVDSLKGGVGGNPDDEEGQAYKLVAWLNTEHPALAAKKRPLTVEQAGWLLKKHSPATLRRILSQMADDPRTSRKEDVYCRMVTFLRWDKQTEPQKKQFTYEEVCNELSKGVSFESFKVVRSAEGKALYWVRKEAIAS